MANNSREARRKAERKLVDAVDQYYDYFISLLHNSVKFEGLGDTPKRYILKQLITKGSIAYDKKTGLYLPYAGVGIDAYGLPTKYRLWSFNGKYNLFRKPKDVVILRVNDQSSPIDGFLWQQAELLADLDSFIRQNLDACRTMTIIEIEDPSQAFTAVNEANSRRVGSTMFIRQRSAMKGVEMKSASTGAQFLVDQAQQVRLEVLNETLQRIGIATANTAKRERVQGAEVQASQGMALDSIYVMCDTFNYDAEQGGLDLRMIPNTSLTVQSNEVADPFKEGGFTQLNPVDKKQGGTDNGNIQKDN